MAANADSPPRVAKKSGPVHVPYVRHQTRTPAPKWLIGLDLGQRQDHSALAVLDLSWVEKGRCPLTFAWLFQPQLTLRSLERVPLGTSYEDIHEIVAAKWRVLQDRIAAETLRAIPSRELIVDAGGPGPPMVDRLRRTLRGVRVTPVIITAGKGENSLTGGYTGIPRRTLVTRLIQMISCQTIRCPAGLAGWKDFVDELLDLSGDSTQPENGKSHDDLVMSTSLAAWAALRDTPALKPGATGAEEGPPFGYIDKPLF